MGFGVALDLGATAMGMEGSAWVVPIEHTWGKGC